MIDHFRWCEERHRIHGYLMHEQGFVWLKHYHGIMIVHEDPWTHVFCNSFDIYYKGDFLFHVYPVSARWNVEAPCFKEWVGGRGYNAITHMYRRLQLSRT